LTDGDVEERLADLRADVAAWRRPDDQGQFSLAGAQGKIALLLRDGRWGVPSGRTPTTHVFKPLISGYDGHVENEHFCLTLAGALGMATAESEIRPFGNEIAIVVRRFDRSLTATLAAQAAAEAAAHAAGTVMAVDPAESAKRAAGAAARARRHRRRPVAAWPIPAARLGRTWADDSGLRVPRWALVADRAHAHSCALRFPLVPPADATSSSEGIQTAACWRRVVFRGGKTTTSAC